LITVFEPDNAAGTPMQPVRTKLIITSCCFDNSVVATFLNGAWW
jgi:hypothetical protein